MTASVWRMHAELPEPAVAVLAVRPVAPSAEGLDPYLQVVAKVTELDLFNLRQHLVGEGMRLLFVEPDEARLQTLKASLRQHGVKAAVVRTSDIQAAPPPCIATRAEYRGSDGSITFTDESTGAQVRLAPGGSGLITIGSLEAARYANGTQLIASVYGTGSGADREHARWSAIEGHHAAMNLFLGPGTQPIHLAVTRLTLVEDGSPVTKAFAFRFARLLELVQSTLQAPVDAGFGLRHLPYGPLANQPNDEKDTITLFNLYSQLVWLAMQDGVDLPLPSESAQFLELIPAPQPAPVRQPVPDPGDGSAVAAGKTETRDQDHWDILARLARRVGPLPLVIPLAALCVIMVVLGKDPGDQVYFWSGIIAGSLLLLSYSLTTAHWRRSIADLPTSRIRSMAMGAVELHGKSRARARLIAPVTGVPCVYYCTSYYRRTEGGSGTRQGSKKVLERRVDSGLVPFYLTDGTDSVLIDPSDSILPSLDRTESSNTMLEQLSGVGRYADRLIVEEVLPEGRDLYILGWARPYADPDGGQGLGGSTPDRVIVGAPPFGGPLLMSAEKETDLLEGYRARMLVFGGLGLLLLLFAISRLLNTT